MALESEVMVIELSNDPSPIASAWPIDAGVRVTVNGFWLCMYCSLIGEFKEDEPSSITV